MHLYHLTLQRPTGVIAAVYGSFSAPKMHEIVLACSSNLEIVRPEENGKLMTVGRSDAFGQVRSLAVFRLTGAKRDYLIVGSDSGRVAVVQFDGASGSFVQIHCETFGKSGVRRIVPGQYTVADPRGRACLLAAVEKQKFVYVLNRDSKEKLTISSPLEAHKTGVVCYFVAALDVGFENPIFAALERPYEAPGKKLLVLYELDLGLNHVVRKQAIPVEETANMLCAVPGGGDGPSGVLVCSHGKVSYVSTSRDHPILSAELPFRDGDQSLNTLIVSTALHKQRGMFFFLFCTERGDLLKVELVWKEETVSEVRVKYLDTLPNAAVALCVMRTGFLFAASEFGDHHFYQIQGLGDDEDPVGGFSTSAIGEMDRKSAQALSKKLLFTPRANLENLLIVDVVKSFAPVLAWQLDDFSQEGSPQIAMACGRGTSSSIRVLRRGFSVQEMAVSELQAAPTAVFTVKENRSDEYDQYIVISFVNATLVLRIGETVEEVSQSGLLTEVPTLIASTMGEDALLQVHSGGVRLIRKNAAVTEWKPPTGATITVAASNPMQVAVALSTGDLVYFELDTESGNLDEIEKLDGIVSPPTANGTVNAADTSQAKPRIAFVKPAVGRGRGLFLAVADGISNLVRILGVGQDGTLENIAVQALPSPAESLAIVEAGIGKSQLTLLVGTKTGVLLRLKIDAVTGQIADKRSRFIGAKPVRLSVIQTGGLQTCFAMSSRSWILHPQSWGRMSVSPLCCDALDNAAAFSSEQCPDGFVAICGSSLKILSLEFPEVVLQAAMDGAATGVVFNSTRTKLNRTPRRLLNLKLPGTESTGLVVTTEADQRCVRQNQGPGAATGTMPAGKWSSSIRLMSLNRKDVGAGEEDAEEEDEEPPCAAILDIVELKDDECALSGCSATFHEHPNELFVCISIGKGMVVDATSPLDRRAKAEKPPTGEIRLYKVVESPTRKLEFVHTTPLEEPCYSLSCFHGRILVGIGPSIRLYELGKKKLLKKSECRRAVPNQVCTMSTIGDRIFVGDVQESVQLLQYKASENRLRLIADDTVPRWMTTMCVVDYHTIFGGDKFGNVFVLRLPAELSDSLETDPSGGRLWESGSSAPHRLSVAACFHVGSTVHAVAKVSLGGNAEVLLYSTVNGAIGALSPLALRSDVDLLQQLELALRDATPPLCGRDHLSYRSYYYPVRNTIDGDLIEMYSTLPHEKQASLAEDYERTPADILHKLEDLRERVL